MLPARGNACAAPTRLHVMKNVPGMRPPATLDKRENNKRNYKTGLGTRMLPVELGR